MKYDWKKIGRRIQKERKLLGLSQDEFCDKAGIVKRATLSKWENGTGGEITVGMLTAMCEVFDCELGYLLCEYDCKTRAATDISQQTGLSEEAVKNLSNLHDLKEQAARYGTSTKSFQFRYIDTNKIGSPVGNDGIRCITSYGVQCHGIFFTEETPFEIPYTAKIPSEYYIPLLFNDILEFANANKTAAWEKLSLFANKYAEYKYKSLYTAIHKKVKPQGSEQNEEASFFLMKYMLDFIDEIVKSYVTEGSKGTDERKIMEEYITEATKRRQGTVFDYDSEEEEDG